LVRPFRSLLYAPADDRAAVDAAAGSAADAVILDLEDRVPADRKAEARDAAAAAVRRLGPDRIVYVRVNPADSGLLEADLDAVVQPGLAGVRVPKTETVADVREVDELIAAAERRNDVPRGQVAISIGLESAAAVRATWELCTASPRVASVAVGLGRGGDLQADLGFVPGDDGMETLYLRSKVVLDARAARVPIPLDGGYGTYRSYDPGREEAAFLRSAETGRRLGYRAKICFHVAQVEAINRIFGEGWAA
jgi:citrate lyase subunit beta / citryl-CoA lyase